MALTSPIDCIKTATAPAGADPASVIKSWHSGRSLSVEQLRVLEELLLENRVSIMVSSYDTDRRAA